MNILCVRVKGVEESKTTTFPVTVEVYNRRVDVYKIFVLRLHRSLLQDSFKIDKCMNKCLRSIHVISWPARLNTLKNIETDEVTIKTLHIGIILYMKYTSLSHIYVVNKYTQNPLFGSILLVKATWTRQNVVKPLSVYHT